MWLQFQEHKSLDKVFGLKAPGVFLLQSIDEIWIRDCYENLFNKILSEYDQGRPEKGVLITGNPGIGKSMYLFYLLWRFCQLGKTVVFELAGHKVAYLFKPGEPPQVATSADKFPELQLSSTIFLHDPMPGNEPIFANAFTVVASSPNPKNFKAFCKRDGSRVFYMPVWREDEVKACNSALKSWKFPKQQISDVFSKFGGIPRFLKDPLHYETLLMGSIKSCVPEDILHSGDRPDVFDSFSHKLLHYVVSEDKFTAKSMNFASDFVFDKIVEEWEKDNDIALEEFVVKSKQKPLLAGARGRAFEIVGHKHLMKVGLFLAFHLELVCSLILFVCRVEPSEPRTCQMVK
jgi:hypothetical protein